MRTGVVALAEFGAPTGVMHVGDNIGRIEQHSPMLCEECDRPPRRPESCSHHPRSAIMRLVFEIARAGLSPFGQVLVQFMMVWQR